MLFEHILNQFSFFWNISLYFLFYSISLLRQNTHVGENLNTSYIIFAQQQYRKKEVGPYQQ